MMASKRSILKSGRSFQLDSAPTPIFYKFETVAQQDDIHTCLSSTNTRNNKRVSFSPVPDIKEITNISEQSHTENYDEDDDRDSHRDSEGNKMEMFCVQDVNAVDVCNGPFSSIIYTESTEMEITFCNQTGSLCTAEPHELQQLADVTTCLNTTLPTNHSADSFSFGDDNVKKNTSVEQNHTEDHRNTVCLSEEMEITYCDDNDTTTTSEGQSSPIKIEFNTNRDQNHGNDSSSVYISAESQMAYDHENLEREEFSSKNGTSNKTINQETEIPRNQETHSKKLDYRHRGNPICQANDTYTNTLLDIGKPANSNCRVILKPPLGQTAPSSSNSKINPLFLHHNFHKKISYGKFASIITPNRQHYSSVVKKSSKVTAEMQTDVPVFHSIEVQTSPSLMKPAEIEYSSSANTLECQGMYLETAPSFFNSESSATLECSEVSEVSMNIMPILTSASPKNLNEEEEYSKSLWLEENLASSFMAASGTDAENSVFEARGGQKYEVPLKMRKTIETGHSNIDISDEDPPHLNNLSTLIMDDGTMTESRCTESGPAASKDMRQHEMLALPPNSSILPLGTDHLARGSKEYETLLVKLSRNEEQSSAKREEEQILSETTSDISVVETDDDSLGDIFDNSEGSSLLSWHALTTIEEEKTSFEISDDLCLPPILDSSSESQFMEQSKNTTVGERQGQTVLPIKRCIQYTQEGDFQSDPLEMLIKDYKCLTGHKKAEYMFKVANKLHEVTNEHFERIFKHHEIAFPSSFWPSVKVFRSLIQKSKVPFWEHFHLCDRVNN